MTSIKNTVAVTFAIAGALILTPFIALFGLMMLGLLLGAALIAAGVVALAIKQAESEMSEADAEVPQDAACAQGTLVPN